MNRLKQQSQEENEKYIRFCRSAINTTKITRRINKLEKKIEQAHINYKDLVSTTDALKRSLSTNINLKDIESIKNHPDVKSIEIEPNLLIVNTGPIYINSGVRKVVPVYVGRFWIKLCRDDIVIFQTDPNLKRMAYDHPHVCGGVPCFGNIKNTIYSAVSENKWFIATTLCIQFLKTYTSGELSDNRYYYPYSQLSAWKRKQKQEAAKRAAKL